MKVGVVTIIILWASVGWAADLCLKIPDDAIPVLQRSYINQVGDFPLGTQIQELLQKQYSRQSAVEARDALINQATDAAVTARDNAEKIFPSSIPTPTPDTGAAQNPVQ